MNYGNYIALKLLKTSLSEDGEIGVRYLDNVFVEYPGTRK